MRDAEAWARLRRDNNEWLTPWEATLPYDVDTGPRSYRQIIRGLRRQAREGRAFPFVVTHDDEVVGQITVSGITWGSARWAQAGYWIARSHAGRGITTLAVAMVTDHCFGTAGLHRMEIAIRPENAASLRVVEKLGFERIGVASRYLHINGAWRDHVLFGLCTEDVPGGLVARLETS
ncbi:MAG: GNAT family N-acetyltransferase [Nocardioidaceae bacterium]